MKIQSNPYRDIRYIKQFVGELNSDQLYKTTLDINNRVSVQFTVEDFERELGIFETIHGSSKKDLEARKKLMKNYKIKRDELDN